MNAALMARIAIVASGLAMILVVAGMMHGSLFLPGVVLMVVSMALFAAAGVLSAVRRTLPR